MKEFIFTWNIENISHSWHKIGETLVSPPFVADTLQNTLWNIKLYPRGSYYGNWISLYLLRGEDEGPEDFSCEFELSCISANSLTLNSQAFEYSNASTVGNLGIGNAKFLHRREAFDSKRNLYLPQDTLRLRCRLWQLEEGIDVVGQCFGCTHLEIERAISVEAMNPRTNKEKTFRIYSKHQKTLLISIDVQQQKRGLKINLLPNKNGNIKFSTFKFLVEEKKKKWCEFVTSWFLRPYRKVFRSQFLNIRELSKIQNMLKLTCEFVYPTEKETNTIEKVSPCSRRFAEFSSNCIISCISSGKISDCPTLYKNLWNLYEKQILCDVELKTQTSSFWVHKTVLCARSPVFLAMFSNDMKERLTNCVEIQDLEDDTLVKLLKYLYTDKLEETQWDSVINIYYAADKYQLEQLKHLSSSYLMNKIDNLNVYDLLILSERHNDFDLREKVEDYIDRNAKNIFISSYWSQFVKMQPFLALNSQIRIDFKECEKENPLETPKLISYPNAMDDMKYLYNSQIGSDIIVQTLTNTFPVLKTILSAGSLTFMTVFRSNKLTNSLKLEDLDDYTISHLLQFLYTDSFGNITWETVVKLYKAAVVYQIERLKIYCSCFFLENLDTTNVRNLLQLAHEHQDVRLKSLVEDFIYLHD